MTPNLLKGATVALWVLLAAAAAMVGVYDLSQRARLRSAMQRPADLYAKMEQAKLTAKHGRPEPTLLEGMRGTAQYLDEKIATMMAACTSRDDFIVREGPRIAWSELASPELSAAELASADLAAIEQQRQQIVRRIGLYLPEGRHQLHWDVFDALNPKTTTREQFWNGDYRKDDFSFSRVELGPSAGVYELIVAFDRESGELSLSVLGEGKQPLVHKELRRTTGMKIVRHLMHVPPRVLEYPSEVNLKKDASPSLDEASRPSRPASDPATELAIVELIGLEGGAEVRLWLESDARPCMSVFEALSQYDAVTTRWKPARTKPVGEGHEQAAEFHRLFAPYDGSGRFYFQKGIIPRRGMR